MKVIRGKKTEFRAVKGVSLAIEEDSLLVLLGHNGAGKTTTLNMLTGLMPANGGDATIFGMSIRNDMALIQQSVGVCPQHDILWERLTGKPWSLVVGRWSLVVGRWSLVVGRWSLVVGCFVMS